MGNRKISGIHAYSQREFREKEESTFSNSQKMKRKETFTSLLGRMVPNNSRVRRSITHSLTCFQRSRHVLVADSRNVFALDRNLGLDSFHKMTIKKIMMSWNAWKH